MGFITGFTGGITLTLALTYLTVLSHERNRQAQALALRSQSVYLQTLLEKSPLPPPRTRAELAREQRSTLLEAAKDRWNAEVEGAVRWGQMKDWGSVRLGMEERVGRVLGLGLERGREGVVEDEKLAGEKGNQALEKGKVAARRGANEAVQAAGSVAHEVERVMDQGRRDAKKGVRKVDEL